MKQEEKERLKFEKAMREAEEAEQIEKQYEEDIKKVRLKLLRVFKNNPSASCS